MSQSAPRKQTTPSVAAAMPAARRDGGGPSMADALSASPPAIAASPRQAGASARAAGGGIAPVPAGGAIVVRVVEGAAARRGSGGRIRPAAGGVPAPEERMKAQPV